MRCASRLALVSGLYAISSAVNGAVVSSGAGGFVVREEAELSGPLTFTLRNTSDARTTVVAEYSVVGYSPDGFTRLAAAVDEVLAEQMKRLAGQGRP